MWIHPELSQVCQSQEDYCGSQEMEVPVEVTWQLE